MPQPRDVWRFVSQVKTEPAGTGLFTRTPTSQELSMDHTLSKMSHALLQILSPPCSSRFSDESAANLCLLFILKGKDAGGGGTIDQESNLNSNNWKTDGRSCLVLSCSPPSSTKDLRAVNKGEKIPGTFEIGGNRLGTRFCTNYMMDGAVGHVSFLHFLTGGRGDDHNVLEMRIPVASDWKQFPTRQLQQSDE